MKQQKRRWKIEKLKHQMRLKTILLLCYRVLGSYRVANLDNKKLKAAFVGL